MSNYLIVANDQRVPYDIPYDSSYEIIDVNEFYTRASGDDFELENPLYFNIDSISSDLYELLKDFRDEGYIIFYKFSDQSISLNFTIFENVVTYQIEEPKVEEESIEEIQDEPAVEEVHEPEVEEQPQREEEEEEDTAQNNDYKIDVIEDVKTEVDRTKLDKDNLLALIGNKFEANTSQKNTIAKVILFGSSKGGTGKSTTCLISARRYAKMHPDEKVALADFDIIDGQIGISILKISPTLREYYRQYKFGNNTFEYLKNNSLKSEHFSPNLDFYLAPPIDIPEVTNDEGFWQNVFDLLIKNYDVVFFDSGIDYLGKKPISKLYKIADKIILTSSTSINAVNSVSKQIQNLSGTIPNNVFKPEEHITDRVHVVLTRVSADSATNELVLQSFTKAKEPQNCVPVIAAFGNLDEKITKSQWWQQWEIWDTDEKICQYLDNITNID